MIVTHEIHIDLQRPGVTPRIYVVQDDKHSRNLKISLFSAGVPWVIPEGTSALVRYRKPDGTGGIYDTLPDGSVALSMTENALTVALAPQVLTVAGPVSLTVTMIKGNQQLTTFSTLVQVTPNASANLEDSEDYFNVTGFLPAPISAAVGQYLVVEEVDADGKIAKVKAVEAPTGGSDSSQNANLTTAQINALDGMFKVCAFIKDDVSAEYNAFKTAFGISDSGGEEEPDEPVTPEKTLTSISAVYSGGDVPVGTAVTALTGIVVTAHYSDSTSEAVTGYTLSGTIAEGSNTITVGYGGKTTTFTVTGIKATNDTTVVIETYDAGLANGNITTSFASGLGVSKLYEFTTELTSGYEYLIGSLPYGEETPKSTNCKAALCVDGEFVYAAAMEGTGKPMNPDNTEGQASMNLSTAIFNGVRVVVAYNYADDSYLYIKSTGQVLFAGKNTPYYGMANIDGTPVG